MTTISKNIKVTYKRPKNKRRFHIDDIDTLNRVMQEAVQVQYNLERDNSFETLIVDSIFMHDLCASFIAMYSKLIEENLILTGNLHKPTQTLH